MKWPFFKNKSSSRKKDLAYFFASIFVFGMVMFFGISYAKGDDMWRIISVVPSPIRVAGRVTLRFIKDLPYIQYEFKSHDLPIFDLRISHSNLNLLESTIPTDPTAAFFSEDRIYVPAKFVAGGKEYDAEVSYRGTMKNHWLWPQKSYRVNLLNDQMFEGRNVFNFIVPFDRLFYNEENNHFRAQQLGLTVPESRFAILKINGRKSSVYWEVEQYGKDFLETKRLGSDANLYGEVGVDDEIYDSVALWKKYNEDTRFNKDNHVELAKLLDLLNNASDEDFNRNIFSILDEDNFYNWSVHNAVVIGQHQDWGHNIRLYFDSSIGKFKIMPWDVAIRAADVGELFVEKNSNPLSNRILSNPEYMRKRNEKLWNYIKPGGSIEAEFANIDKLYESTKAAFYQDKLRRFTNKEFDDQVSEYTTMLKNDVEYLRSLFTMSEFKMVVADENDSSKIILETKSLSPILVESGSVYNIYPNIIKKQVDPGEATRAGTEKYYQAFELQSVKTEITLNESDIKSGVLRLKNIYTGEMVSVNIEKYVK